MTDFPMTVNGFADDHMHYWLHAQENFFSTSLGQQHAGRWPELDPQTNAF